VLTWLEREPDQTSKEIFARLQIQHRNTFRAGQLRTLQRRVKDWRMAAARRLVFSGAITPEGGTRALSAGGDPHVL